MTSKCAMYQEEALEMLYLLCGSCRKIPAVNKWPGPREGLFVSLSLSHWYPGSGVVLDCIDS